MATPILVAYALGVVGAVVLLAVGAIISMGIGFIAYTWTSKKHIQRQGLSIDIESDARIYFSLALTSGIDALISTVMSSITLVSQLVNNIFIYLPLIIGAVIALPIALVVIEYHPEMVSAAANLWQCGVNNIFYGELNLMTLVNSVRVVYGAVWPFWRVAARFTRLFARTLGIAIIQCIGRKFFIVLKQAALALSMVPKALVLWIGSPGSIVYNRLNLTDAFQELLKINVVVRTALDCSCESADFLWAILTDWISKPFTAEALDAASSIITEIFPQLIVRSFVKQNNGTVPGVTTNYGWFPNVDRILDNVLIIVKCLGRFVNFQIYVSIREFVGLADPSLFVPGSPEEVVLASDWVGSVTAIVCALIEVARKWAHIITAVITIIVQGAIFLLSLLWGPGTLINFGPNLYCDSRDWRAIFDYGGPVSLYFKNGSVFGYLYEAVERFCNVLDLASPYACGVIKPLLLMFLAFINAVGFVPLYFLFPPIVPLIIYLIPVNIPFVLVRLILHLFDSEWRMFDPPIPPRTGIPLSNWVPAPAIGPAPVTCAANPSYPGYLWPWVQHYLDDPDGFHLLLVNNLIAFGQGLNDLFDLFAPFLGKLFFGFIVLPSRFYDFLVQTVFFFNVVLFESQAKKALFFARWRYALFFNSSESFGIGLAAAVKRLDVNECSDALAYKRIFCCLSEVFIHLTQTIRELGFQVIILFTSGIVPPLVPPNANKAIDKLQATIEDLLCAVSAVIYPLPLNATNTLQDSVRRLLQSFAPALVLFLRIANALLHEFFQLTASGNPISNQFSGFSTFFVNFFTTALNDIKVALGDGVLVGIGAFLDEVLLGGEPAFKPLFQAIVDILATLSGLVQKFAFELITFVFRLVAAFISIFIGTGSVGTRILNFLKILGDFIVFLLTKFPTLLLDLILGLIEKILPAPLGTIIVTFARLLINGFCTVLQFFIDTITKIINALSKKKVTKPNLCCSGAASCSGGKRSVTGSSSDGDTVDQRALKEMQDYFAALISRATMTRQDYHKRMARFEEVLERHAAKKRGVFSQMSEMFTTQVPPAPAVDESGYSYVPSDGLLLPLITANGTVNISFTSDDTPASGDPITKDEAMQLVADLVEWEGASACDQLVLGINASGTPIDKLPLLEYITLQDCLVKRTLGEIVSIMPYMTWFPRDGFYNGMRWVELSMQAVQAYQIYAQFRSDKEVPRAVALSDTYKESWAKLGLRVDHLVPELYVEVVTNWTLMTYVERNNGNAALIDAVTGYMNAVQEGFTDQALYFENLRTALANNSVDPLQAWIDGSLAEERQLPQEIQEQHLMWTAMISLLNSTYVIGSTFVQESRKRQLVSKIGTAIYHTPQAIKRAWQWVSGGVAAENEEAWEQAKRKRDLQLEETHAFDFTLKRELSYANASTQSLSTIAINMVKDWFWGRLATLQSKLMTPNTVRAQRNRLIVNHFFSEMAAAWAGDDGTTSPPPVSLSESVNTAAFNLWSQRVAQVKSRNERIKNDTVTHPYWHPTDRVSTYATGNLIALDNGTFVAELQVCNLTLVPFCLGCLALDLPIAEAVISIDELITYFEPGGYFQNETLVGFNKTQEYIGAGASSTVCPERGGSTNVTMQTAKQLHWPSDQVIWTNGYTVFDLLGGGKGLVNGVIGAVSAIPSATLSWVLSSIRAHPDSSETLAPLTAKIVETVTAAKDQVVPDVITLDPNTVKPTINIEENRIYDYASTHTEFDLNYLLFDIFKVLRPLLLALDALGQFFTRLTLTFTMAFDPITGSMTVVPKFDGSGELGFIGALYAKYLAADYTYTCDRRRLPLFQGIIIVGLGALVGGFLLSTVSGAFGTGVYMVIFGLFLVALPYAFFLIVYNYPVQNLFLLPLPPMCLGDDAVEMVVCDLIPKVPAVFAMAAKTPYTEYTGYGCPIDDSKVEWLHCKRDFGMIDAIDVFFALFRWVWPQGLRFLINVVSVIPAIGPIVAGRIGKFATLDLSNKEVFDHLFYCSVVIGSASTPTLVLLFVTATIVVTAAATVVFVLLRNYYAFFYALYRLLFALDMVLVVGMGFFVSPGELIVFRDAFVREHATDASQGRDIVKRRRLRRRQLQLGAENMGPGSYGSDMPIPSRAAKYVKDTVSDQVRHYIQDVGLDYYWQVSSGSSTPQQLEQLLEAKNNARREQMLREKQQQQQMRIKAHHQAIFQDF